MAGPGRIQALSGSSHQILPNAQDPAIMSKGVSGEGAMEDEEEPLAVSRQGSSPAKRD